MSESSDSSPSSRDPRFDDGPVDPDTDRDPADQPVDEVRDEDLTPLRELSAQDRVGDERLDADDAYEDPDVEQAEKALEGDDPDGLDTDELGANRDDADGWEAPDRAPRLEEGQTMAEQLAAEVPDDDASDAEDDVDRDLLES